MISGNPVKSEIARTSMPASSSSRAVPPVDTISMPRPASPRAKSTMPVLSETDSNARRIRTSPGWVTPRNLSVDQDAPRVVGVAPDRPGGDAADRLAQQLVLVRAQRVVDLVLRRRVGQVDRVLEDDRPRVHALVDEVDGDAEDLDAVVEALLDR